MIIFKASAFLHLNIEQAVTHALADSGVTIHNNCYLAQWEAGPDGTQLTQVSFTTETKPVVLDCRVCCLLYPTQRLDYKFLNSYPAKLIYLNLQPL